MTIFLGFCIVVLSVGLAAFFVGRDAKKFALAPPTPLIDLDRMYDAIFIQLDEVSGSAMTPKELLKILDAFILALDKHGLIREDLAPDSKISAVDTLESQNIVDEIMNSQSQFDVPPEIVANVVDLAFAYLRDIRAVS